MVVGGKDNPFPLYHSFPTQRKLEETCYKFNRSERHSMFASRIEWFAEEIVFEQIEDVSSKVFVDIQVQS